MPKYYVGWMNSYRDTSHNPFVGLEAALVEEGESD